MKKIYNKPIDIHYFYEYIYEGYYFKSESEYLCLICEKNYFKDDIKIGIDPTHLYKHFCSKTHLKSLYK